jgi:hypothetical protein
MRNKQGGLSRVIKSIDGAAVGKIVQCISYDGDHSKYGPIWKVRSKDIIVTEFGGAGNEAHIPDDWMVPIKPGELDNVTDKTKKLEKVD